MTDPRISAFIRTLILTWFLGLFSATATAEPAALTFERDIRPILKEFCFDCHGAEKKLQGGLDLRLRRLMAKGGEHGAAFVPGKPEESLLVVQLRKGEMPPEGKKVPEEKIKVIARWIAAGAPTLRDEPQSLAAGEIFFTEEERGYWAFQPIAKPRIPEIDDPRVRTPIDALITDAGGQGFSFAPDADAHTLLRRASLGLTGLPPLEEKVALAQQDLSGPVFDQVVDRFLSSLHYGERWARHWLDVAGYADSEGANHADAERAWAWRYRDYVIRAFNDDKPFDRFILEQLAGDELVPQPHKDLTPGQIELLAATGFLRMAADPTGTGGGSNTMETRNQTMADTLQIVASAFLGLSVHCAQCHDHLYDPIPQRDYFQMRAIFEPAFNPKEWKVPGARAISLYTDADHQRAAEVEAEARLIIDEKNKLQARLVKEAIAAELKKCPDDQQDSLRQALDTPKDKRSARQKELLASHPNLNITGGNLYQYNNKGAEEVKSYDKKAKEVRSRKPPHPYIRALTEVPGVAVTTRLFHRGDAKQPVGDPLLPAPLTIAAAPGERPVFAENDPEQATSGRRSAFARWLANGKHPLVARVIVNRIWMHHFGEGLVATPGEFGLLGAPPTHPELLDYLAHEFMENGWSIKHLHRLIMRSTVYRQSSVAVSSTSGRRFARWPLQRLDAETVRDRTLVASGELARTPFGPPVPVKENDAGQYRIDSNRRSLYAQVRRSRPITLLRSFDAPDMKTNCNRRATSNAATQALVVMNGDFHRAQAAKFANQVRRADGDVDGQIVQAFARA
ncbi:MAG: PSD1 and planctomycete cytochrome C domain-containing protein [Verrucomicrobiota bacterium]